MEDAISKAMEWEYSRALASPYSAIKEIYKPGWRGWQDLPGADLVAELVDWMNVFSKEHKDEPFFPAITSCVATGELSLGQVRQVFMTTFAGTDTMAPAETMAAERALMTREREIRDIVFWHSFDETSHNEMLKHFCESSLGIDEITAYRAADEVSRRIFESLRTDHTKEESLAVSMVRSYRDGPTVLAGCVMLAEGDIYPATRKIRAGMDRYYKFDPKDMSFINVHTYIDIYHQRLGQYLLAKYCTTKDLKDACRDFFIRVKEGQYASVKALYDRGFAAYEMI